MAALEVSRYGGSNSLAAANRLDKPESTCSTDAAAWVLSSGTTVPGRYESFDLGFFPDPPLRLGNHWGPTLRWKRLTRAGKWLIAFLGDVLREPCVVISEKKRDASLPVIIVRGRGAGRRRPGAPAAPRP